MFVWGLFPRHLDRDATFSDRWPEIFLINLQRQLKIHLRLEFALIFTGVSSCEHASSNHPLTQHDEFRSLPNFHELLRRRSLNIHGIYVIVKTNLD